MYYFAKRENYKYCEEYEHAVILKTFAFRFVNSFGALFWIAFSKKNSFQEIYAMLLPVLIIN